MARRNWKAMEGPSGQHRQGRQGRQGAGRSTGHGHRRPPQHWPCWKRLAMRPKKPVSHACMGASSSNSIGWSAKMPWAFHSMVRWPLGQGGQGIGRSSSYQLQQLILDSSFFNLAMSCHVAWAREVLPTGRQKRSKTSSSGKHHLVYLVYISTVILTSHQDAFLNPALTTRVCKSSSFRATCLREFQGIPMFCDENHEPSDVYYGMIGIFHDFPQTKPVKSVIPEYHCCPIDPFWKFLDIMALHWHGFFYGQLVDRGPGFPSMGLMDRSCIKLSILGLWMAVVDWHVDQWWLMMTNDDPCQICQGEAHATILKLSCAGCTGCTVRGLFWHAWNQTSSARLASVIPKATGCLIRISAVHCNYTVIQLYTKVIVNSPLQPYYAIFPNHFGPKSHDVQSQVLPGGVPRKSNRLQITNQRLSLYEFVTEKCQTWSTELNYATPSQHVTYLLTILRTLEFQWVSRDSNSTGPLLFLTFPNCFGFASQWMVSPCVTSLGHRAFACWKHLLGRVSMIWGCGIRPIP